MPLPSCNPVSASCSQGGNATSMQSLSIISSSSFPHKYAFLQISCFSFRVSVFFYFSSPPSSSQFPGYSMLSQGLSPSFGTLCPSQPILSLPLPCSSLGTTPLLSHFLPLSPRLFPSQFYQLYPSCLPRVLHFSLATIHMQGTAKDATEPYDQNY